MNLLIVHEVNYLEKIIYEFQILPEMLSMLGHNVTVIDYDDSWQSRPADTTFKLKTTVYPDTHRAYPQAKVTVRRPGMIRLPVLSRVSGAALTAIEVARILRTSSIDAVLLYGLPTVGVQTLLAARRFRVPVFFRSIDILNRLAPYKLLAPPTRALEGLVYRRVEGISCVTPHLRDYVKSYGVPAARIEVLPSGVDVQMFSPGPRNLELLSKWGIGPTDPVVLFMGTVYTFSGLDRVIHGFREVLARHPQARLLVVGVGEDAERLQRQAAADKLQAHVLFAGFQPYALLPDIIRSSTVCINPFELNDITRDILPTKLFQYLACGKPVLMTELPGTLPFLAGPSDGVVYSSSEEFVRNLNELLSNPERIAELGANAQRVAQRDYDWKSIAVKLLDWMKDRIR